MNGYAGNAQKINIFILNSRFYLILKEYLEKAVLFQCTEDFKPFIQSR